MASEHHGKASRVTQFQGIEENVSCPLCCDRCLGPSNLLRMTKEVAAKKCNVCSKPFTLFSWKVAADQSRPKSTIICRSCAESRGKCQSCLGQLATAAKPKNDNDTSLPVSGSRRNRDGEMVDSNQHQQMGAKVHTGKNNIISASITSKGGLSFLQNAQEQQQEPQQQQRSKSGAEQSKDNTNKKADSTTNPTKKSGFSFDWMHSS